MKRIIAVLGCALLALNACGKDEEANNKEQKPRTQVQQVNEQKKEVVKKPSEDTLVFLDNFEKYDPAQKYYFCAAFAMKAMWIVKPVTAKSMVNYFMGLGVSKYGVGINDHTYEAFNAGRNVFQNDNLVNTILERKICENIVNDAIDYARERNYRNDTMEKRGQKEFEKVVKKNQDK